MPCARRINSKLTENNCTVSTSFSPIEEKNLDFFTSAFKSTTHCLTHLFTGIKDLLFLSRSFSDFFVPLLLPSSSLAFIFHLYVSNIFSSSSFLLTTRCGVSLMNERKKDVRQCVDSVSGSYSFS